MFSASIPSKPTLSFLSSLISTSSEFLKIELPNMIKNNNYVFDSNGRRWHGNAWDWRDSKSKIFEDLLQLLCHDSCDTFVCSDVWSRSNRQRCLCRNNGTDYCSFSLLWGEVVQFLLCSMLPFPLNF